MDEEHPRYQETVKQAKELAGQLTSFFNNFDSGRGALLVEAILNEHRTLQQNTAREFIFPMIKAWATTEWYDGRNEATRALCQKVESVITDEYLPFI